MMGLEDERNINWDQFETNKKLFGVESSYQEDLYTTRLDKDSPIYVQRQTEAEHIAKDIEGIKESNPHVMEERGFDDSGLDEEERYGAVLTENELNKKYVPPPKRMSSKLSKSQTSSSSSSLPKKPEQSASTRGKERVQRKENRPLMAVNSEPPMNPSMNSNGPTVTQQDNQQVTRTNSVESFSKMPASPQLLSVVRYIHEEKFKPQTSPIKSPLTSSLVSDPSFIKSLSLNPASPSVSEKTAEEFIEFKKSFQEKKKQEEKKSRADQIQALKNFSKALKIPASKKKKSQFPFFCFH